MKPAVALFLALTFMAITECAEKLPFSQAELEFFKNLKVEQLPLLTKSVRSSASDWFCAKIPPIQTLRKSKSVGKLTKVSSTYNRPRPCRPGQKPGKKCYTSHIIYSTKTLYHTEYYGVPFQPKCAQKDIVCKPNLIEIEKSCFSLAEILKDKDKLEKLNKTGMIHLPLVG